MGSGDGCHPHGLMSRFILVDCNNFFVSCERLFRPDLEGKPVIVLSSNDGCVVSRSKEAKDLGIAMGVPFFEIRELCAFHSVVVCSSNFTLYRDISSRVMQVLWECAPSVEVYSIDEAFLEYGDSFGLKELFSIGSKIRGMVLRYVGIPTSVGIGPTKTLAKIATDLAKKEGIFGVADLCRSDFREKMLARCDVGDIWGVGSALAQRFRRHGVMTALDVARQDPSEIRASFGVVGERIVLELCGKSCRPLQTAHERKSIICSRSFGEGLDDVEEISYALCSHVSSAACQLREEGLCAGMVEAFIEDKNRQGYSSSSRLLRPTNETAALISQVRKMFLSELYSEGKRYRRCGVIFSNLVREEEVPLDLFEHRKKSEMLSPIVDEVNQRFGKGSLFYAATGTSGDWKAASRHRSGRYTTGWDDVAVVRA